MSNPFEELVIFTKDECQEIYSMLDMLSGGNARSVFALDEKEELTYPHMSCWIKLFKACGKDIPIY